jgi:hypothetical protein
VTETLAERECRAHGFDPALTYRNQYQVTPASTPAPSFFCSEVIGAWRVSFSDALNRCLLKDAEGVPCGMVLGHAVTDDGRHLSGEFTLDVSLRSPAFPDRIEAWLKWASGRFAALVVCPAGARLYPDPSASFGFVFDPATRSAESSLLLALHRAIEENPAFDNAAMIPDYDLFGAVPRSTGYTGLYGFGMTRDRHVRRVVANHYLDLETFDTHRFWPRDDDLARFELARADLADLVIARLRSNVAALAENNPSVFLISGGYDSRMVLAAAGDTLRTSPNVAPVVFASTWIQSLDVAIAQALGAHFGFEVGTIIPDDGHRGSFLEDAQLRRRNGLQYILATGSIGQIPTAESRGFLEQLPHGALLITGNMLEIASAVWWPPGGGDDRAHALKRCMVAQNTAEERRDRSQRYDRWFEGLPDVARDRVHDFSYIENTLPNTQTVHLGVTGQFRVPPANDRAIFAASMCAPVRWRRKRGLYDAIVTRGWPELAEFPTVFEMKAAARVNEAPSIDDLVKMDLRAVKRQLVR